MRKINDLLLELCPNGVQFLRVDQVCVRRSGLPLTAGEMKVLNTAGGDVRIFAGGKTFADVKSESLEGKYIVGPGLIVKSRGIIDFEFWLGRYSHKNELWSYQPKNEVVNLKFLYYFLKTKVLEVQLIAKANSVKMPQIKVGDIDGMFIPVPPLEIQNEIVRVLDTFTELEAELEAELDVRKTQYEFYRESLFNAHISTQKSLDSVASIWRGRRFVKDDIRSEGTPAIHYGEIYTKYGLAATETYSFLDPELASRLRFVSPGDVVLVSAGETIEDIGKSFTWLGEGDAVIHDACYGIRSSEIDPRYMVHFFNTHNFRSQLRKYISSSKISAISTEKLGKVFIPVPSPEEQKEIADVLDSIDCLVSDLSVGLPGEIDARRQQYEYYRGKLLTFKELEVA